MRTELQTRADAVGACRTLARASKLFRSGVAPAGPLIASSSDSQLERRTMVGRVSPLREQPSPSTFHCASSHRLRLVGTHSGPACGTYLRPIGRGPWTDLRWFASSLWGNRPPVGHGCRPKHIRFQPCRGSQAEPDVFPRRSATTSSIVSLHGNGPVRSAPPARAGRSRHSYLLLGHHNCESIGPYLTNVSPKNPNCEERWRPVRNSFAFTSNPTSPIRPFLVRRSAYRRDRCPIRRNHKAILQRASLGTNRQVWFGGQLRGWLGARRPPRPRRRPTFCHPLSSNVRLCGEGAAVLSARSASIPFSKRDGRDLVGEHWAGVGCIIRVGHVLPLRSDQRRMWLLEQLDPSTSLFGIGAAVRITRSVRSRTGSRRSLEVDGCTATGAVDADRSGRRGAGSVHGSIERCRHPLRRAKGSSDAELPVRADRFLAEPFDFTSGRLARFLVLEVGDRKPVVVVAFHHTVGDLWSLTTFMLDLAETVRSAGTAGTAAPRRSVRSSDFVAAERRCSTEIAGVPRWTSGKRELPADLAPSRPFPARPAAESSRSGGPVTSNVSPPPRSNGGGPSPRSVALTCTTSFSPATWPPSTATPARLTSSSEPSGRTEGITTCGPSAATATSSPGAFAVDGGPRVRRPARPGWRRPSIDAGPTSGSRCRRSIEELRGPGSVGDVALPIGYHWLKANRRVDPASVRVDLWDRAAGRFRPRPSTVAGSEFAPFQLSPTTDSDLTLEVHQHDARDRPDSDVSVRSAGARSGPTSRFSHPKSLERRCGRTRGSHRLVADADIRGGSTAPGRCRVASHRPRANGQRHRADRRPALPPIPTTSSSATVLAH